MLSWFAVVYFIPSPPATIVIAGGFAGSHYERLGARFKEIIERRFHVNVVVRTTGGAPENLRLMEDPQSGMLVVFMQGGARDAGGCTGYPVARADRLSAVLAVPPVGRGTGRPGGTEGKAHWRSARSRRRRRVEGYAVEPTPALGRA